ncbi:hypothetical protein, partial [Legionella pneumophila]
FSLRDFEVSYAHRLAQPIDFRDPASYAEQVSPLLRRNKMSKKTVSQMEALLMDKIEQAKVRLDKLQQKHKIEIGMLAYKHGLQNIDTKQLDNAFAQMAKELIHEHA